jgi:chromosome condensin MukBEF MukE localization factor
LAIRRVSMISVVSIIYVYLVSRSTTIIIMSLLSKIGSFVMKSIVIYSYSYFSTSANSISPYDVYRDDLFR